MSRSGHFRAHGRRALDLTATLERGETKKPAERPGQRSTIPARPGSSGARRRASESVPRDPASDAVPQGELIRIVNLSLGGACIEVAEAVTLGARLTVEIVAPTLWDPLVLPGRVVWSRGDRGAPHRAGLSFEHTDPARAFALFELLGAHDFDV